MNADIYKIKLNATTIVEFDVAREGERNHPSRGLKTGLQKFT